MDPPAFLMLPADSSSFRSRNNFVAQRYGKVGIGCQAISPIKPAQGCPARFERRGFYSLTGTQISRPPLPVSGSNLSS
jgi:hypothetical protein